MKRIFLIGALIVSLAAQLVGAESRTYRGDRIAVSVNGTNYPGLVGWSGGEPRAVVQASGNKKQVSSVTYDPIVIEVLGVLHGPLLNAVKDFCAGAPTPVSLQLQASSYPTLEASNAVLTKVEFPALDASAKDSAYAVLTFSAATTRTLPGPAAPIPPAGKLRAAVASNFRFAIDGLPSTRIATVSSLVISRESGRTNVANVVVSVSSADADAWTQWRDQFLLQGQNTDAQEKNATLSLLDPAMKNALLTLSLSHVGLVQVRRPEREVEAIARIDVELYIESVSVSPTPAAQAQADAPAEPAPAPEEAAARINDKESDLAGLLRRKQSLEKILATQEAERKGIDPKTKDVWEKTRLPVITKLAENSQADLKEVEQQIKTLNEELAALKTPAKTPTGTPPLTVQKQKPSLATQTTKP